MTIETLRRRLIRLHMRRARLCEAYGLWAGAKLTPRERQQLGRMGRAIVRLSARIRAMVAAQPRNQADLRPAQAE